MTRYAAKESGANLISRKTLEGASAQQGWAAKNKHETRRGTVPRWVSKRAPVKPVCTLASLKPERGCCFMKFYARRWWETTVVCCTFRHLIIFSSDIVIPIALFFLSMCLLFVILRSLLIGWTLFCMRKSDPLHDCAMCTTCKSDT